MNGFALLWQKTLLSSLWIKESKETRLLFLTMLMLKNSDGVVQASVVGLADAAKLTVEECREGLKALLSPDPDDTSKVDNGRRIREIPGGWKIINSDAYRFSTEAKRAFWAQQKAEQRARENAQKKGKPKKAKPSKPAEPKLSHAAMEQRYVDAYENGKIDKDGLPTDPSDKTDYLSEAPVPYRVPSEEPNPAA